MSDPASGVFPVPTPVHPCDNLGLLAPTCGNAGTDGVEYTVDANGQLQLLRRSALVQAMVGGAFGEDDGYGSSRASVAKQRQKHGKVPGSKTRGKKDPGSQVPGPNGGGGGGGGAKRAMTRQAGPQSVSQLAARGLLGGARRNNSAAQSLLRDRLERDAAAPDELGSSFSDNEDAPRDQHPFAEGQGKMDAGTAATAATGAARTSSATSPASFVLGFFLVFLGALELGTSSTIHGHRVCGSGVVSTCGGLTASEIDASPARVDALSAGDSGGDGAVTTSVEGGPAGAVGADGSPAAVGAASTSAATEPVPRTTVPCAAAVMAAACGGWVGGCLLGDCGFSEYCTSGGSEGAGAVPSEADEAREKALAAEKNAEEAARKLQSVQDETARKEAEAKAELAAVQSQLETARAELTSAATTAKQTAEAAAQQQMSAANTARDEATQKAAELQKEVDELRKQAGASDQLQQEVDELRKQAGASDQLQQQVNELQAKADKSDQLQKQSADQLAQDHDEFNDLLTKFAISSFEKHRNGFCGAPFYEDRVLADMNQWNMDIWKLHDKDNGVVQPKSPADAETFGTNGACDRAPAALPTASDTAGAPGRTRAHQGAAGRTRAQQGAPGRTRAHQGAAGRSRSPSGGREPIEPRAGGRERGPAMSTGQAYFDWLPSAVAGYSEIPEAEADEETGLMGSLTAGVGKQFSQAQSLYDDFSISTQTWMYFFALLAIGVFFIFCSSFALPFIIFSPHKFASLFTLGSLFVLSSFVVLRGPDRFQRHMFETKQKKWISLSYLGSLATTLYFTYIWPHYIFILASVLVQCVALLYFLFSYIPGGTSVLNTVFGLCCPSLFAEAPAVRRGGMLGMRRGSVRRGAGGLPRGSVRRGAGGLRRGRELGMRSCTPGSSAELRGAVEEDGAGSPGRTSGTGFRDGLPGGFCTTGRQYFREGTGRVA
eukprot:gene307-163_t